MFFFCISNNFFLFLINFSIWSNKTLEFNSRKIILSDDVSGKPPRSEIIIADPLLEASRLVLPKGSFHLEQTTVILVFSKFFKTSLCVLNPRIFKFLCLKLNFSLCSSPITFDFHVGYLFKILIIVLPNISYPFELLSLPTKEIKFSFFVKSIFFLSIDWWITFSF